MNNLDKQITENIKMQNITYRQGLELAFKKGSETSLNSIKLLPTDDLIDELVERSIGGVISLLQADKNDHIWNVRGFGGMPLVTAALAAIAEGEDDIELKDSLEYL